MKKRLFNTILSVNSVFQAISCLISPAAFGALIAWLLTSNGLTRPWIYAVLITLGVLVGFISMIGFLVKTANYEKAMREAQSEEEAAETAGSQTSRSKKEKDTDD